MKDKSILTYQKKDRCTKINCYSLAVLNEMISKDIKSLYHILYVETLSLISELATTTQRSKDGRHF